jgi:hypothetical protein
MNDVNKLINNVLMTKEAFYDLQKSVYAKSFRK